MFAYTRRTMRQPLFTFRFRPAREIWSRGLCLILSAALALSAGPVYGLTVTDAHSLPAPGTRLTASPVYQPPVLQGLTLDPENPLRIDFLVRPGDDSLSDSDLSAESQSLIKYFLTALTVPEDRMWVNLSPYEADRIIPEEFGQTDMGRELLAQDYLLKQLSASLMYPEEDLGRIFWERVRAKAVSRFGTAEIPMNTFNKVWIVPERAVIHRTGTTVMVTESRMKVLLEEDYTALQHHALQETSGDGPSDIVSGISADVVREVIIPEIEREVNEGRTFARLRQIYQSLILAVWYKQHLRDSLLGQLYVDQGKTDGITQADTADNERIYRQYVTAFERGVYNYIREDVDPVTDEKIPRKYFSGGVDYAQMSEALTEQTVTRQPPDLTGLRRVSTRLDGLGEQAGDLRLLSKGEAAGDQAVLAERILQPEQVTYLQQVWRKLSESEGAVDAEVASDIEFMLNSRSDEKTRFYAVAGNWMRMLDTADQILDFYAPNRLIDLDSPSNMFQLALERILMGFTGVYRDEHAGIMIVRVTDSGDKRYRFDTILLDRSGEFFVDQETEKPVPIEQVLSSQLTRGPQQIWGDNIAQAVLASDRFSVLSVRPNGSDTSDARYWESHHYIRRGIEIGQRRFRQPPVKQGTVFVMTAFLKIDEYGGVHRDFDVTDSAALAEEELPFNQGVQQIAGWLGLSLRNKPADQPLVIVLHGRHGAGKTVTKDLIVEALEEFGFRLDPERRKNGSKTIHRYNAWRAEDKIDEAWANNFYGHTGLIIVETVENAVPMEWRQADNLLLVHLRAEESRRRKRIERKGAEWAGQLDIKAVHENGTSLKSFRHRISIENSGMDINKVFQGTMRFQTAFENTLNDKALLAVDTRTPSVNAAGTDSEAVGGIDLNPANMSLETTGDTGHLPLAVDPQLLQGISVDGFVPVILNISPATTLPLLLGSDTAPLPTAADAVPAQQDTPFSNKLSRR